MSLTSANLNLTDPTRGYAHFVLYVEARIGVAGAAWNATVIIERQSPYAREWQGRLIRCEPNPLHATFVDNREIPELFHPCVDEDEESPVAISGSGCVCRQTFYDPEFGLPVVAKHYRPVGGRTDLWTYTTYAPLGLRPGDVIASLVIDRISGLFWSRTTEGTLSLLPERNGHGYQVGYAGAGPVELAEYLHKLIASDGRDTAIEGLPHGQDVDPRILAWVRSPDANRTQELTMEQLKAIQRG
ncbi:hypothetical protein [Sphaerisporangium aureirubrum]|uniref:Uncharacterized protein n=1 Tax=Sphaerisporangium aureirubrum TaxID=1544736 RepID=A0ABW1NXE0_9ACTN